jgi:hypothetical protein
MAFSIGACLYRTHILYNIVDRLHLRRVHPGTSTYSYAVYGSGRSDELEQAVFVSRSHWVYLSSHLVPLSEAFRHYAHRNVLQGCAGTTDCGVRGYVLHTLRPFRNRAYNGSAL